MLQVDRDKLVVKRDKKLLELRDEFDPEINRLNKQMESNVIRAEKYATIHRETLFGKLKSTSSSLTTYGFRLGNDTLALLNRKWSWDSVIAAIKSKGLEGFIITKEAPDKDAIKLQLDDAARAEIGTRIVKNESFFIEPKRDLADPQRLVTAGGSV